MSTAYLGSGILGKGSNRELKVASRGEWRKMSAQVYSGQLFQVLSPCNKLAANLEASDDHFLNVH